MLQFLFNINLWCAINFSTITHLTRPDKFHIKNTKQSWNTVELFLRVEWISSTLSHLLAAFIAQKYQMMKSVYNYLHLQRSTVILACILSTSEHALADLCMWDLVKIQELYFAIQAVLAHGLVKQRSRLNSRYVVPPLKSRAKGENTIFQKIQPKHAAY